MNTELKKYWIDFVECICEGQKSNMTNADNEGNSYIDGATGYLKLG